MEAPFAQPNATSYKVNKRRFHRFILVVKKAQVALLTLDRLTRSGISLERTQQENIPHAVYEF